MGKFFTIFDLGIAAINKNVAVIGISLGVILAFINVVLRYSFGTSLTWAGELTNYLFMWSALFGAAYGFKKGIHISVTILLALFPVSVAKAFVIFSHMVSFVYLAMMSYFGYQLIIIMQEFGEMSIDLNIPMWIPQLVLPIAFAGAAFRAGEKIFEVSVMDADKVLKNNEHEVVHDASERSGVHYDND
ncbi:MAG: TRAP transporter small permease [Sulfurospirillum sp.]|nr:TRAP transporter small permease [Sulfurospirillum sp.]